MIANVAAPLLGLADTAAMGRFGGVDDLAALALGSLAFNCVYWTFGFLRMGTTGFVSQAFGAGNRAEVGFAIGRALSLGAGIGVLLVVLGGPLARAFLPLFGASEAVEGATARYFAARIWGAPGMLCSFAIMGGLIGLGKSRALLAVQAAANLLNICLDWAFAGGLSWGVVGVGAGTAISEWAAAGLGLVLLLRSGRAGSDHEGAGGLSLRELGSRKLLQLAPLLETLATNANIMIRTLALLSGFAWFTHRGARFGAETLAANHVLLQFISFSAFFLDGYAFATEGLVGAAVGARDRAAFAVAVRRSWHLALLTAVLLAASIAGAGRMVVDWLTDLPSVERVAGAFVPLAAVYVLAAAPAFQLDGIFIGLTRSREMRDASLISVSCFLVLGFPLASRFGNVGLWLAFIGYAAVRGVTLRLWLSRLWQASLWPSPRAAPERGAPDRGRPRPG